VTFVESRAAIALSPGDHVHVALINLSGPHCDGLAFGTELTRTLPWVEIVFWFDEKVDWPVVAAARSLGVLRVVPLGTLAAWLGGALTPLVRISRARREQMDAERALPPIPASDGVALTLPLPVAERRFRETYVRKVLADTSSRAAAARQAGLPYTTFVSMVTKMRGGRRVT
jgi:hypothetical protein